MAKENIITLTSDDGEINVEVIDQTVVDGVNYLLVADVTDEEEDNDCFILKDTSNQNSDEANYEVVSDEDADKIFEIFTKMLKEEIDFKK